MVCSACGKDGGMNRPGLAVGKNGVHTWAHVHAVRGLATGVGNEEDGSFLPTRALE